MLKQITYITISILSIWYISKHYSSYANANQYPKQANIFSAINPFRKTNQVNILNIDIIEKTNKERLLVGLSPLATNPKLNESAQLKVDDMINKQYFEHDSPTGEGVSDLGTKAGYIYVIMGENLALGQFSSPEEVVKAWMDSPGHKENILNKKYQDIGISIKKGSYEGNEVYFAVQHFGTSKDVCPIINLELKKEIGIINKDLKQQKYQISKIKKTIDIYTGASTEKVYQDKIKNFNDLIKSYNSKLKLSKQKINTYNLQVKNFNKCITAFQ